MGRANPTSTSMLGVHGGTDSWCTPRDVADPLADFYDGPCDFDPCSNADAIIQARRKYTSGGLHIRWVGTGFKNPPFSKTGIWATKAMDEIACGNTTELVTLVMFAPSTGWWAEKCGQANVEHAPPSMRRRAWGRRTLPNPTIICTKRLAFIGDKDGGARFDTAMFYFGKRHERFLRCFKHITKWTTRGRV